MSNTYTHLAANATTLVNPQATTLYAVTINTKGASSNTLTLQDGTGGPTIAVIDTTSNVGTLFFKAQCKNGLSAVMATGTAADVTILTG
jgi:hypothetical protein